MEGLIKKGLLRVRTATNEWIAPDNEDEPMSLDGYVVSFEPFHERGLAMPPHQFLRGLLDYYNIELQHLNLNGIQHIAVFIVLCEGFLGIDPHFKLWRYFFAVSLHRWVERERRRKRESSRCRWGARASIFGETRQRSTCRSY
jgi:hypothetical protein